MSLPDPGPTPNPFKRPPSPPAPPYPASVPTERDQLPLLGPGAPARLMLRAVGLVVDLMLIGLVAQVVVGLAGIDVPDTTKKLTDAQSQRLVWIYLAIMVGLVVYQIASVAIFGRTFGMLALNMRLARFADGARPGWNQAGLRAIVPIVPSAVGGFLQQAVGPGNVAAVIQVVALVANLAVYLTALSDPFGRSIHDRASGTIVLKTR